MSSVNRVILLGNLGKDPEVRSLESGKKRASFSLATNETYKNKEGEKVTNTEWHNVVLWYPLAEIAEKYLEKGNQVYIEGKITSRSYTDKDGQIKYITEVAGNNLVQLGSGSKESAIAEPQEREAERNIPERDFKDTFSFNQPTTSFNQPITPVTPKEREWGQEDGLPF